MLTGAMDVITDGTCTAVGYAAAVRICGGLPAQAVCSPHLTGVYCGANPDILLEAAVTASEVMKHCGETAEARVRKEMEGTASFRTRLIDAVSLLNAGRTDAEPLFADSVSRKMLPAEFCRQS